MEAAGYLCDMERVALLRTLRSRGKRLNRAARARFLKHGLR